MRLVATQVQGQTLAAFALPVTLVRPSNPDRANRLSASSGILADDKEGTARDHILPRISR